MSIEQDILKDASGEITLSFIGHGSLMIAYRDLVIQVDPFSKLADYRSFPPADLILITHEHPDHLDLKAIEPVLKDSTELVCTRSCLKPLNALSLSPQVMGNGDAFTLFGVGIEAVPAYNKRKPFHRKGVGNGYILTFGECRIYIAGDTDNIEEMKNLKGIKAAFLPMNLPFTMTPKQVADAAMMFRPEILYPYHYGKTETGKLIENLEDSDIEVRIRRMS